MQYQDPTLGVRVAAYQCILTLLRRHAHKLDKTLLMDNVSKGFVDYDGTHHPDIMALAAQIFEQLAQHHAAAVVDYADKLAAALLPTVKAQYNVIKSDFSQRENDRVKHNLKQLNPPSPDAILAGNIMRNYIHLLLRVNRLPGIELKKTYQQVWTSVVLGSVHLKEIVNQLAAEL